MSGRALDVVVRAHDPARLDELGRAVFSVALSDVRPLTVIVACQRMDTAAVRRALAPIMAIVPEVALTVLNRADAAPRDARAALLNLGIAAGSGRYLAFLDYDDVIYPEGHRVLIEELEASVAAVAFGGIVTADVTMGVVPVTRGKRRVFHGAGLGQLLHDNFCPLHSFVVDRARVDPADLVVDEGLGLLEDYDLLLRLCARYPSSFRLKDKIVGEYVFKDDGSNANPFATPAMRGAWDAAVAEIGRRKAGLLLSPGVQGALGVDVPGLTVAGFLAGAGGVR